MSVRFVMQEDFGIVVLLEWSCCSECLLAKTQAICEHVDGFLVGLVCGAKGHFHPKHIMAGQKPYP